jgi:outer membrane protein
MKNAFTSKSSLVASALLTVLLSSQSRAETLAEIFALAQKNDAVLKAQEATSMANRETSNIARAALLPQVSFNATHSETNVDDGLLPNDYDTTTDSKHITASQTLFNLEYWHNYRSGTKIRDQAEAQFRSDQQELIVRVVSNYTDVLSAIDAYKTAIAEQAAIGRQLDQTKQRFDVGLVAITDVFEAQATYDDATVNVLNAKGAVGIAFEALDNITGTSIQTIAPLSDAYVISNPEPLQRDEWVTKALANNAQLQATAFAKEAALQNAKAKRAAHFPTLTASYQHNDDEIDADPSITGIDADRKANTVALNFNMPLFAGGGISATRRQAWDQYNAASEQYTYAQRTTIQAARSYHLAVTTDVARVSAQKQAILSAQSSLDATNAGYEAGTRNIVDVLNSERALYYSQLLWHQARYKYISDRLKLEKVAGELVPEVIDRANKFVDPEKQIARSDFDN